MRIPIQGFAHKVSIDGGTAGDSFSRFCLGTIANIERNDVVKRTLLYIGKGINIEKDGNTVTVANVSNQSIYIQSLNWNLKTNKDPRFIYKLRSGESTTIFCAQFFANKLKEAVAGGNYETVSSIQNMCSIRMSFIKGWGPGYIRSEITMSPCWVEVLLLNNLCWFDSVINEMGSPIGKNSSNS